MINTKVSKIEIYQEKWLKLDFEAACNAKYFFSEDMLP